MPRLCHGDRPHTLLFCFALSGVTVCYIAIWAALLCQYCSHILSFSIVSHYTGLLLMLTTCGVQSDKLSIPCSRERYCQVLKLDLQLLMDFSPCSR